MLRIDLDVPFADNARAQRLGARWDPARRVWFVPENRDASPFARWLTPARPPNVRAHSYLIAAASLACWRCAGISQIHGFALPPGHETLEVDDDSGEECWESNDEATLLCYLEFVVPDAIEAIRRRSTCYRYAYRRRTQSFYNDVAENARNESVRAFAAEMSNDEQRHVAILEELLDRETDLVAIQGGDAEEAGVRKNEFGL